MENMKKGERINDDTSIRNLVVNGRGMVRLVRKSHIPSGKSGTDYEKDQADSQHKGRVSNGSSKLQFLTV